VVINSQKDNLFVTYVKIRLYEIIINTLEEIMTFCQNCGIPLKFLKNFISSIPEVSAAFIVSMDGLVLASELPQDDDEDNMATIIASLLSLARRSIIEMKQGEFDQLYIKASDGYLLALQAGPDAVLVVSTTRDVKLK